MIETTQAAGLTDEQIDAFIPPSPVAPKGYWLNRERAAIREAIRAALAAQAVPSGWACEAAKWLRAKAEEQRKINAAYPQHVACYPSWEKRVRDLDWLADELDRLEADEGLWSDEVYLREKAVAWLHVADTLTEVAEWWHGLGGTSMENAAKAIRQLAASPAPAEAKEEPPFLVRDVAELIGCTVPDIHRAAQAIGIRGLSTNMQIFPDEARAIAAHLKTTPQPQAAQPVGEAGAMPGTPSRFTMACFKAADVPLGTKLYTAAPALTEEQINAAVTEFDEWAAGGNQQTRECIAAVVRAALRSTQGGSDGN